MSEFLTYPTSGNPNTWTLTEAQVAEWSDLYPGLDVSAECRHALAWIKANHRKTARGMPRFLVNWLNRANDMPKVERKSLFSPARGPKRADPAELAMRRRGELMAAARRRGLSELEARRVSYQEWLAEGYDWSGKK